MVKQKIIYSQDMKPIRKGGGGGVALGLKRMLHIKDSNILTQGHFYGQFFHIKLILLFKWINFRLYFPNIDIDQERPVWEGGTLFLSFSYRILKR